jgi:hypothetical protein
MKLLLQFKTILPDNHITNERIVSPAPGEDLQLHFPSSFWKEPLRDEEDEV